MDTLVHDPFHHMPAYFGMEFRELLAQLHPSAWVNFEKGLLTQDEFLANFFGDGRVWDQSGFVAFVRQKYRWIEGIPELLADLREADVELHTLSNYPVWWQMIEEELRLSEKVAWTFVSCNFGVRKPDPQAYLQAASAAGRAPQTCVFVDDRTSNCDAAAATGMAAIRFESAPQLRGEFVKMGIL